MARPQVFPAAPGRSRQRSGIGSTDTVVDRGVRVAGNPETCLPAIGIHEAAGVDELQSLMATERRFRKKRD